MKKGTSQKIEPSKVTKPNTTTKKPSSGAISTNEDFLKRSLKLLGVTDQRFQKETKAPFWKQFFPKPLPTPSNSKQFFFICYTCILNLVSKQQEQEISMWYPPRTVNQQIEFKKVFFKILQRLQAHGIVPKNLIISKMVLMGDANAQSILQVLRILSEISLRALYIQKYSKNERLIQIAVTNSQTSAQNDINKFYVFPFNETVTNVQPPLKSQVEADSLKKLYRTYIEMYRKKILALRTVEQVEGINPQKLMSQILQQKQLALTLQNKVSKSIYSQNRAFDRRVILDKNAQIWKQLFSVPCSYIEQEDSSVLRVEGDTAKLLENWRPTSGTPNLIQFNNEGKKIQQLKARCKQKIAELAQMKQKWSSMVKNTK